MEALYEFTVLKVRANILSKKSTAEEIDTKNDDDLVDGDDEAHDTAPHQTLEKFIEVSKSIVTMLK